MNEPVTEKVKLKTRHTDAGVEHPAGAELEVSPPVAAWLIERGIAERVAAGRKLNPVR